MVALNLALNCTLIFTPLREAGLAWSTAFCSVLQIAILGRMLARRAPGIVDSEVVGSWRRSLIASAVMAAAVVGVVHFLLPTDDRWSVYALRLGVGVVVGAGLYFALARLMGMQELRDVLRRGARSA
jgi:peptidoglycan biosynthesis protein MviN/MurJ (putative lipid II flippase)